MSKVKVIILTLCLAIILVGCGAGNKNDAADKNKLQVVTTYSILYDIVKNIGGERVEVRSLVSIGSDPHEYDPLPGDVEATAKADLVFYNGLNLETGNSWFAKLLETTGKAGENAPVFRLSEGVEPMYLTGDGQTDQQDPHAWLDIRNGIKYAENAKEALIKVDPTNTQLYEDNAQAYIKQLEQLHNESIERIKDIPEEHRFLITSEGAFKYFSAAYDFQAGYIWEINSEGEGTAAQISAVIDLIRTNDIKVLFLETSIDSRSMDMISNETKVPIGGKIFTDSIGKPGDDGDSYLKMMEWNMNTIIEQLTPSK